MKFKNIAIFIIISSVIVFFLYKSTKENADDNSELIYYQAKSLELANQYYSLRTLTVWQDSAYILALDNQATENGINWIVIIDHNGNTVDEITYKTKSYIEDDWQSSSDIVDIQVDSEGGIWLLEETGGFRIDNGFQIQESMEYQLISLDEDGRVLNTYPLTDINKMSGEIPIVHTFLIDSEGYFYFLCNSDSDSLYVYNSQGTFIRRLDGDIETIFKSENGQVMAKFTSIIEEVGSELRAIDTESWTWRDSIPMSGYYRFVYTGHSYDLLLNDNINLYGYDFETNEYTQLLNWIDNDFPNGYIDSLSELSDGKLIALATDIATLNQDIIILEPISADLVQEHITVTLATGHASDLLRKRVVEFNRAHSDYKIRLVDYSVYDTPGDTYVGQRQFFTEITSGEIPDIIDFYTLPADKLVYAGLMEDLYPFLEQDAYIGIDDFLPSLIRSLDVDGALYQLPYRFYLTLIAGDHELVGEKQGWTIEALYRFMDKNDHYQSVFQPHITQIDFLKYAISFNSGELINWPDRTCNFESDEFYTLLQFTKKYFPINENASYDEDPFEGISQGEYPFIIINAFDIIDIVTCNEAFGGNANFIGFPTAEGIGNAFIPCESFGITNTSEHKEIAWEFIREFFLDDEDDTEFFYFFPAKISGLERSVQFRMGEYMDVPDAVKEEESDKFWELLSSINRLRLYDNTIEEIVVEEAMYYLMEDKSVEDVAKIIQNRVQTILSE